MERLDAKRPDRCLRNLDEGIALPGYADVAGNRAVYLTRRLAAGDQALGRLTRDRATSDLEMPESTPSADTRSSTDRVDTPLT